MHQTATTGTSVVPSGAAIKRVTPAPVNTVVSTHTLTVLYGAPTARCCLQPTSCDGASDRCLRGRRLRLCIAVSRTRRRHLGMQNACVNGGNVTSFISRSVANAEHWTETLPARTVSTSPVLEMERLSAVGVVTLVRPYWRHAGTDGEGDERVLTLRSKRRRRFNLFELLVRAYFSQDVLLSSHLLAAHVVSCIRTSLANLELFSQPANQSSNSSSLSAVPLN